MENLLWEKVIALYRQLGDWRTLAKHPVIAWQYTFVDKPTSKYLAAISDQPIFERRNNNFLNEKK
jgi:hypothetical protein